MRNWWVIDTLTSVDIQKIVTKDRKVIEKFEGVISRKNLKVSQFRKDIEKLYALTLNYKDEG